jgi:hypothetical protein
MMNKLQSLYRDWQERRRERRIAQAEAARSLEQEPSTTTKTKGTGLPPT